MCVYEPIGCVSPLPNVLYPLINSTQVRIGCIFRYFFCWLVALHSLTSYCGVHHTSTAKPQVQLTYIIIVGKP